MAAAVQLNGDHFAVFLDGFKQPVELVQTASGLKFQGGGWVELVRGGKALQSRLVVSGIEEVERLARKHTRLGPLPARLPLSRQSHEENP